MAAPSAQRLQSLAGETGYQPGMLEKVLRLLDLLQEISRDQVLSDRLALKGGTALNLFYLGLDRLSVDIDLNYVGALDWRAIKAAMLAIGASGRRDWCTTSLESINGDQLEQKQQLAICLPRKHFVDTGGMAAWIEETVARCREGFAFLLDLRANEREFLDGVLDRGEVDVELLDAAPELRARIQGMPMLAWKTYHVRKQSGLNLDFDG